jgi:hypothetical protein
VIDATYTGSGWVGSASAGSRGEPIPASAGFYGNFGGTGTQANIAQAGLSVYFGLGNGDNGNALGPSPAGATTGGYVFISALPTSTYITNSFLNKTYIDTLYVRRIVNVP